MTEETAAAQPTASEDSEVDDSGRQRLLDAAEELFATHGYAATTTRQISEHAGLSRGMLYYHFPSKEALFHAFIKERSPLGNFESILDQFPDDPKAAMIALGTRSGSILSRRGRVLRAVLRGGPSEKEALSVIQQRAYPVLEQLTKYLVRTLGSDRITPQQARTIAHAFASSLMVSNVLLPPPDPDQYVEDLVDTLLHGFLER